MKQVKKEVKSKSVVVDTVMVPQYDSVEEAIKAVTKEKVLGAINKVVSDGIVHTARAAIVRPSTPQSQLARLAKSDPKVQREIEALIAKYQKDED